MKVILSESILNKLFEENTWTNISDEDYNWALEELEKSANPNWDEKNFGYFLIDVSGRHSVYYTLWRYRPSISAHVKPFTFWQNLSTDFKKAVQKAKILAGGVPVFIEDIGTQVRSKDRNNRIQFGKYKNEYIEDIFQKDPRYITWVWDKIQTGDLKVPKPTQDLFQYFNSMYWETVKKTNKETISSKHIGNIGDTFEGKLTIKSISQPKVGPYGTFIVYTLTDEDGNYFITYNLPAKLKEQNVKVGDSFNLSGTIDGHKEFLGINQTLLKKVKVK